MKRADELSFELARAMLAETSPDEVPVLDALGLDFVEASSAPHGGDGALGFDIAQVTMAVAASSVAVAAKDYLLEVTKTYALEAGSSRIKKLTRFLKKKRAAHNTAQATLTDDDQDNEEAVALDVEEISAVRKRAYEHARGLGLSDSKANLLADALAGSLT